MLGRFIAASWSPLDVPHGLARTTQRHCPHCIYPAMAPLIDVPRLWYSVVRVCVRGFECTMTILGPLLIVFATGTLPGRRCRRARRAVCSTHVCSCMLDAVSAPLTVVGGALLVGNLLRCRRLADHLSRTCLPPGCASSVLRRGVHLLRVHHASANTNLQSHGTCWWRPWSLPPAVLTRVPRHAVFFLFTPVAACSPVPLSRT